MIRAGAEALKSAASSEALTYYREALELYLKKQGERADPSKVAILEKNIARSLYFKGWHAEAIPYYDRLQKYYGIRIPNGRLAVGFEAVIGAVKCMFWLYGLQRKKLKPLTPELLEGLVLSQEKSQLIVTIDAGARAYAAQVFILAKQFLSYDLYNSEPGRIGLLGISSVFSFSGISIALARRLLEKMGRDISPESPRVWMYYLLNKSMFALMAGEWADRYFFRDPLIERQSEQGNAWAILNLFMFSADICLECGDWNTFLDIHRRLEVISERFDNDYGREIIHFLLLRYFIKRRMVEKASDALSGFLKFFSPKSSYFGENTLHRAHAYSSREALLRGDFESAAAFLRNIPNAVLESANGPYQNGLLCWAYAAFGVEKARRAAAGGRLDRKTRRECLADLNRNLKNVRKYAPDRTEALKFAGSFWWYAGAHRRALSYWRHSIREGERLGAKVELAHTFSDAGALLGEMAPGPQWKKRGAEMYAELGIGGE
jgi:hypothetical protein